MGVSGFIFKRQLMEYHDIFSLDKNEIGCTDAVEQVIELLDEEPFKEKFRWIAPPLLDEVWEHLQEMLDGGAIWPSQSAWCNACSPCLEEGWGGCSSVLTSGS